MLRETTAEWANSAACLLDKFNGRLKVQTEVDERPLNALSLIFFLFKNKHRVVEQLL